MRTDVKVRRVGNVRLPNIPLVGSRPAYTSVGDMLQFRISNHDHLGRVVGFVNPPEDPENTFIVVLLLSVQGVVYERWVLPADVVDCGSLLTLRSYYDKLRWYFSEDFEDTPPDLARNAFNLTADEIRAACRTSAGLDKESGEAE